MHLQFSGHQRAAESVNAACNIVNSQFNIFKIRCIMCIASSLIKKA